MSRLLRARAWPRSGVVRRYHICLGGDVLWLRLACAAGLVIGIAQQLVLLARSIRMRMLGTFWVRLTAATMLCAGVACWYLANSRACRFWSLLACSWYSVGCGGFARPQRL